MPDFDVSGTASVDHRAVSSMKRILIATPLKGDIPRSYFKTSLQLAAAKIPDVKLDWCLLEGPAVQQARNELVAYAFEHKFDELVWWDKDVLAEQHGEDVTAGALLRLLKHDVDIVCAIYATRSLKTHWHMHLIPGEHANEEGLQKVSRSALGFSKMKMSVFKRIAELNSWRRGILVDPNHPPHPLHEFFPMGLQGPNTPERRLETIRETLGEPAKNNDIMVERIKRLVDLKYDEPNVFVSEDYWFCDLVQKAGIDIHIDTKLIMAHSGKVALPIETPQLLEMLSEPWRKDEIKAIKAEMLAQKEASK